LRGGLGAGRHEAVFLGPRAGSAVAHREDVVVQRRLQGLADEELVDAVGLEAVQAGEELGALDAGSPHHQLGRQHPAVGQAHATRQDLGHLGVGMHVDAEGAQQLLGGARQPLGQGGQHAGGGLDHRQLDVLVGIDPIEAVGHHFAGGVVELGGQFDPRCAGADDCHMQLLRPQRRALGVGAHAGIHHAYMEAAGVGSQGGAHRHRPRQPFTMRTWKRRASAGVSSFIAFSRTPGVPKSLLWLPTEMIRVS